MDPIYHNFNPVFNNHSSVLILGTFPSVKSREMHFYYGHPQDRFWKVLSHLTQWEKPLSSIDDKIEMLLTNHIAVWDVIKSCEITGSSDSSIKNVEVNPLEVVLNKAPIKRIYTNGGKAFDLFQRYCQPYLNQEATKLPSTSPANAAYQLDRLIGEWKQIQDYI